MSHFDTVNNLNPTAYYRLGESIGSSVAVDETGTYNGTYNASPTLETFGLIVGDSDTAVTIDGVTDQQGVRLPVNSIDNVRCISLSFKLDEEHNTSSTLYRPLLVRNASGGVTNEIMFGFEPTSGKLRFSRYVADVAYSVRSAKIVWEVGVVYHAVIQIDSTNGMMMFVNGVKEAETDPSTESFPVSADVPAIGSWGDASITWIFKGTIDDVSLFDYALNETQITELYNSAKGITSNPSIYNEYVYNLLPTAYWRFDETSGTTAKDEIGGFNGVYNNTPLLGQSGLLVNNGNRSVEFNGTDEFVTVDDLHFENLGTGDFAVSESIFINSPIQQGALFYWNVNLTASDTNETYLYMYINASGQIILGLKEGVAHNDVLTSNTQLKTDTPYHIVAMRESGVLKLYINGVQDNNTLVSVANIGHIVNPHITSIGRNSWSTGTNYFKGRIDEVYVFDYKALTQDEVTELYKSSKYITENPSTYNESVYNALPVAYWRLGESSGTVAKDETGSFNGTYVNTPSLGQNGLLVDDQDTSVYFDGVNQYTSLPLNLTSNISNSFSIVISCDVVSASGTQYLINLNNDGIYAWILLGLIDNNIRFLVNGSTDADFTVLMDDPNSINHVTLTAIENGDVYAYINGKEVGKSTVGTFADFGSSFNNIIGASRTPDSYFNGTIDDVSIFDKALTSNQVQDLYNASKKITLHPVTYEDNVYNLKPVAYWKLGDHHPISIDDDFTGADGDDPNKDLWEKGTSSGVGVINLQDNKVRAVYTSSAIGSQTYISTYNIIGDFDVQIDVSAVTYSASNSWYIGLLASSTISTDHAQVGKLYNGTYRWLSRIVQNDAGINAYADDAVNFSGLVRIVRTGTTISTQYDVGGGWIEIESKSWVADDVKLSLYNYTAGVASNFTAEYDNFKVNSGTIINPTAIDQIGQYNGSYINQPTLESKGLLVNSDDIAVSFDGVDHYVENSTADFRSSDDRGSISFSLNNTNFTGNQTIFASSDSGSLLYRFKLYVGDGNGNLYIYTKNNDTADQIHGSINLCDGVSHNVVVTSNGSVYKIFVDGIEDSNLTVLSGVNSGRWLSNIINRDQVNIGSEEYNSSIITYFGGIIDEVSIFDYTLTKQDVESLYNSSKAFTSVATTYKEKVLNLVPTAYYRLGDSATVGYIDDYFIGQNGDIPNTDYWKTAPASGTAELLNNSVHISNNDGTTNPYIVSKYGCSGDFEVEIDFTSTLGSISTGYMYIDTNINGQVIRTQYNLSIDGSALTFRASSQVTGFIYDITGSTIVIADSKIKVSRVGSIISHSYWNGSVWISIHSATMSTNDVDLFRVGVAEFGSNPLAEIYLHSFQLTADSINNPVAIDEVVKNNGTYVNLPTLETTGLLTNDVDNAVTFDGVDQYLQLDSLLPTLLTQATGSISFIANFPSGGECRVEATKSSINFDDYFTLKISEAFIAFGFKVGGAIVGDNNFYIVSYNKFQPDTTYNICFVQDDTNGALIYVNGELIETYTFQGNPNGKWFSDCTDFDVLTVNSNSDTVPAYYNGTVDELIFLDYKLTQAEVTDLYQSSQALALNKSFDIIIDHSKVTEDLYNFPVLVNLGDDSAVNRYDTAKVFDELPKGEYLTNVDDDFTGTDGDLPNDYLWNDVSIVGGPTYTSNIQNNKLKQEITNSTSATADSIEHMSKWTISGDFDITIDFSNTINGNTNHYYAYFQMVDPINNESNVYMAVQDEGVESFRSSIWNGIDSQSLETTRTNLFGKMRIVRVGTVITTYYADGSGSITQLDTRDVGNSPNFDVRLRMYVWEIHTTTSSIEWDNLILDKGLIVWDGAPQHKISAKYKDPSLQSLPEYAKEVMSLNPTAYWRLGESSGTTAYDETGNYNSTYIATPTLGASGLLTNDVDTAVSFNGTTQYVESSLIIPANDSISSTCKVRFSDLSSISVLFGDIPNAGGNAVTRLFLGIWSDGHWYVSTGDGTNFYFDNSTHLHNLKINTTYHISYVMNGTSIKIYLDGSLVASYTSTTVTPGTIGDGKFSIARQGEQDSSYTNAIIDEVAIYPISLTQDQVTRLYKKSIDVITQTAETEYSNAVNLMQPVAYWRLGEAIGQTIAVDETGNYNGTYINVPTLETTGLLTNDVDTAVTFDGIDQYIERIESGFRSSDSQGSLSALINLTNATGNCVIFGSADTGTNSYGLWIYVHSSGTIRLYSAEGSHNIEGSINVIDGSDHHIVLTSNGTSYKIYVDGIEDSVSVLTGSNNGNWFADVPNRDNATIGASKRSTLDQFFRGTVDEVSIFNTALTQSQVTHLYNTSKAFNTVVDSQECKIEIDRWDQTNEQAQLWVKVPYISKDRDTVINFNYDALQEDNSSNIGITGSTPAQDVWTEYDAVYHLSKDGTDSTSNNLDGALKNIDSSNIVDFGIGKGMSFNGTNEWIDIGQQTKFDLYTPKNMTVEVLFNSEASTGNSQRFIQNRGTGAVDSVTGFISYAEDNNATTMLFDSNAGGYTYVLGTANTPVNYGTTSSLVTTFNNFNGVGTLSNDGELFDTINPTGDMTNVNMTSSRNTTIGCAWDDAGTQSQFMNGKLKEIRFAKNLKSEGWISSNDDSTKDSLVTFAQAETYEIPSAISTKAFDIVIDHTKIGEDVYNFPILVNLDSTSGIGGLNTTNIFDELDYNINVNDDFTGTDGDDPNPALWDNADGVFKINNNKLQCSVTNALYNNKVNSKFTLVGDFDIQVDYDITSSVNTIVWRDKLRISSTKLSTDYVEIERNYDGNVVAGGDEFGFNFTLDGSTTTHYEATSGFLTSALRLVRIGTLITGYYFDNGTWVQVGSSISWSTDEIYVQFRSTVQTNANSHTVDYDNFRVNEGTIVWDDVPTNKVISAIYKNPAIEVAPDYATEMKSLNPVAYWRLGESAGAVAYNEMTDYIENEYHGSYVGSPTLGVTGLLTNDSDTAIQTDTGKYMTLPLTGTLIDEYSFSCVMTLGTTIEHNYMFYGVDGSYSFTFSYMRDGASNGANTFYLFNNRINQGGEEIEVGTPVFPKTGTYHVVLTKESGNDASTVSMYIDGVKQSMSIYSNDSAVSEFTLTSDLDVGNSNCGTILDEMSWHDRVLTQDEVTRLYNKSIDSAPTDTLELSQQCKIEIDRWDQINEQAQLWLKVPYISKDRDTVINFSFDSANSDNSENIGVTGSIPAKLVWTEYDAVYHMSKDGTDSAGSSLDGIINNMDSSNIVDFGIGKGLSFNGTDENIDISPFNLPIGTLNITTKLSSLVDAENHLFSQDQAGDSNGDFAVFVLSNGTLGSSSSNGSTTSTLTHSTPIDIDTVYDISVVWDGVTRKIYLNDTIPASESNVLGLTNTSASPEIGSRARSGYYSEGLLKNIRFASKAQSSDWISSNNDSTSDSLVTFAHATSYSIPVDPITSKAFDIIIDHSKVKEDLYDFPVLVNLDSASGLNAMDSRRVFTELNFSRSVDDTFTGVDNDPLDTELWDSVGYGGTLVLDSDPNHATIQSNKFKWNVTVPDTTGTYTALWIESKFQLTGDYDFEVEFDGFTASQYILYYIQTYVQGMDSTLMGKELSTDDSTYNFRSRINNLTDATVAKSSLFGKIRMTRVGGTYTNYYKDGGDVGWTELDSNSSGFLGDCTLQFKLFTGSNTAQSTSINFDNFILNSGTVVWPTGSVPTTNAISTFYVNPEDVTTKRLPYYNTEVLADNPVAYYRLGEASGVVAVDEVGNYDGVYNNSPTLGVTSLLDNDANTAVSFDGVSQSLTLPDALHSALQLSATGSISFIAQFPVGGASRVNFTNSTTGIDYITFYVSETSMGFTFRNNTSTWGTEFFYIYTNRSFAPNTKYNITYVQDDTKGVLMYVNGMLMDTYVVNGTVGSRWIGDITGINTLSVNVYTINTGSLYYEGTVDELSFFDTNLSAEQVERLYKKSVDITTESGEQYYANAVKLMNPVAYWRLGDSAGTVAVDEMGLYNGTYVGDPTLNQTGLLTNDVDTAVNFNGIDQHINIPDIITDPTVNMSYSLIVKTENSAIDGSVLSFENSIGYRRFDVRNSLPELVLYNYDGTQRYVSFAHTPGNTYHIVGSYDMENGIGYLYVDGVLVDSGDIGFTTTSTITTSDSIGSRGTDSSNPKQYSDATIDEVAVFDRLLSASEAKHLYDTSKSLNSQVTTGRCKTEIDRWDQVNQQAQLWVKVPYISKDVDTIINFSYDSGNADNSSEIGYTGTTPAQAVWSEYDAVYHLSKDGADSTSNAFDGTLNNIDSSNIVDFGIGKGMTFNGTDEYIDLPNMTHGSLGEMSFEVTSKADTDARMAMLGLNNGGSDDPLVYWRLNESDVVGDVVVGVNLVTTDPTIFRSGVDTKLLHRYEFSNIEDGVTSAYLDGGNVLTSVTGVGGYERYATDLNGRIGATRHAILNMDGKLKEFRFAKKSKSEGWVASNYDSTQDSLVTYVHADTFVIGVGFINGITKVNGTPTSCRVYIYDENMVQVDFLNSAPDGTFESNLVTNAENYYVLVVSNTGECPEVSGLLTATELPSV